MAKWDPSYRQGSQFPLSGQISCDRTQLRYDLCWINGQTVLDPTTSAFFVVRSTNSAPPYLVETIKPYPRKFEAFIMAQIKELTITSGPFAPSCQVQHTAPALVFSAGGYTGNFFHDFNDGFIPLYITVNTIYPDQDFVMVVSEAPDWWISKYVDLLSAFTAHPIVTLNDTSTHCFPSVTFGLISHGFMTMNQRLMPNSKTITQFRGLLDKAYSQSLTSNVNNNLSAPKSRPRLIIASRNGSAGRVILNQDELIEMSKELGFDVIIFEPKANTSLQESYVLVNSSHAMIGVHGAALTHSLFLRPGSVLVQVVPIGLEWASDAFFGRVGRGLKLEYVEYKIGVEESSLVGTYGSDSLLLTDPHGIQEQNVKLDMKRFREYLKQAYKKAKQFMDREG
ncbi:glycosyltransferase, putative [Ricinus communis]|uniref:Glycosyltransferase, putative n=1 Tax=Ricinus communis TaxID=3988 RepID=B9RCX8_RICCO|nr:glycosyltransferase, putative [Ricinus communis]